MPSPRPWLSFVVVAVSAFVVVNSVLASFELIPLFPYLDQLFLQGLYFYEVDRGREGWFALQTMQANEHVVLFPMPLYWLDNVLFAGRGLFLVAAGQAIDLATAWLLASAARRGLGLRTGTGIGLFAALAAALQWSIHGVNLFWPYQIHLHTWFLFWVVSIRCAARADATRRAWPTVAAMLAASVALFSFGFGIAGLGALTTYALLRWPWRWSLPIAAVGAAELAFYWQAIAQNRLAAGMGDKTLWQRVAHGSEHVLYLLSNPLHELGAAVLPEPAANALALAATALALLAAPCLLWTHLRRAAAADAARTLAALLLGTCVLGALTTAISRATLTAEGARADRYAVLSVCFWFGTAVAAASRLRHRRDEVLLVVAAAALPLLVVAHLQEQAVLRAGRDHIVAGEMAVLNDATDTVALAVLHPDFGHPLLLARVARGLRERQWSLFAGPQDEWIGQQLDDVFARAATPMFGFVHGQQPAAGGTDAVRVDGYAFDRTRGEPPRWLVLVDGHDRIAGVAHRLHRTAAEALGGIPEHLADDLDPTGWWVGYVHGTVEDLRAFAIRDGEAVPLRR